MKLIVQPYKWETLPSNDPEINDSIYCWCLDRNSQSYLIRINDFYSFCNIELPTYNNAHKPIDWNNSNIGKILDRLNYIMGDYAPQYSLLKYNEKAYFFKALKKYPMLQLYFKNFEALKKLKNYLNKPRDFGEGLGLLKLEVWESEFSNIRKLLSIRKSKYCQWFEIEAQIATDRVSTLENEYIGDKNTLNPIPLNESSDWVTNPSLLSIDIETYSDNHKALPKPYNPKHVVNIITLLYTRLNSGIIDKYAITDGECNNIPDAKVIRVADESQLLETLQNYIVKLDPDVLIGYNILLYDYAYLHTRISRNISDWNVIGRLYNTKAVMKVKRWESAAYGIQNLNILQIPGRISIDLYPIIQRDYKLNKYTLDFVSNHFLGLNKHDVKPREMFVSYENVKSAMGKFDNFIIPLFKLPENYDFTEKRDIFYDKCVQLFKSHNLTQYSQMLESLKSELDLAKTEFTRIVAYCIQDSFLVIKLIETLNTWIGLIEMSNVVGVDIMELFTGGQQQRCISQLYDLCYNRNIVLDYAEHDLKNQVSGGLVQEMQVGVFKGVVSYDFNSLYPSLMITYNICPSTYIKKDLENSVPEGMYNEIEFDQIETKDPDPDPDEKDENIETFVDIEEEKKQIVNENPVISNIENDKKNKLCEWERDNSDGTITRHYRFRFIKPEYFKGLIPELVQSLINERNYTRKVLMKPLEKELELLSKEYIKLDLGNYNKLLGSNNNNLEFDIINKINTFIQLLKENSKKKSKEIKKLQNELKEYKNKYFDSEVLNIFKDLESKIYKIKIRLTVLDCIQLAKKVSANSFYGLLAVKNGAKFSLLEASMAVTAKGRESITKVKEYIFDKYENLSPYTVTGDTDSLYVLYRGPETLEKKYQAGLMVLEDVNATMEGVMKMDLERCMVLLGIKPKHYAYAEVDTEGNIKLDSMSDIKKRGLYTAKRGNAKWSTDTYDSIVFNSLQGCNLVQGFKIILNSVQKLLNNSVHHSDLSITRGVGDNYKSDSYMMKVFSDELKAIGKPITPNSRIDYLICESTEKLLGKKMKLLEDYLEKLEEGTPYIIDKFYYLNNVLMNPIDTVFNACFYHDLPKFDKLGYKPKSRKNFVSIRTPVKMIIRMIEDGISLDGLEQWLENNYNSILNNKNVIPKLVLKSKP